METIKQEVSEQDKKDCIAFFESKGVCTYEDYGSVIVDIPEKDLSVEISAVEIMISAGRYREMQTNDKNWGL